MPAAGSYQLSFIEYFSSSSHWLFQDYPKIEVEANVSLSRETLHFSLFEEEKKLKNAKTQSVKIYIFG